MDTIDATGTRYRTGVRSSLPVQLAFPVFLAFCLLAAALLVTPALLGQAAIPPPDASPPGAPPTVEEIRKKMAIASTDALRGQQDGVGFAQTAEQMKRVWEASEALPAPESLGEGPPPEAPVVAILAPHDDYAYAARVYRKVAPLVTAKTVVLVGVFHGWRKHGARDQLVFDVSRPWRSPDGPIAPSPLRDEILAGLPKGDAIVSPGMHDGEHSLEALAFWLKHRRGDLEILPIIVPAAPWERMKELGNRLGASIASAMAKRNLKLGQDVAVVISSDAVHYGEDFRYTPYGDGGESAYRSAVEKDRLLLTHPLAGNVSIQKAHGFMSSCVDSKDPGTYRLTWCGRFSIPLGLLTLESLARNLGVAPPKGYPLAYATSLSAPALKLEGLGVTAPATQAHFVGYPAVAYVLN
jgi:AmmeMemoRadiSam system protein B